MALDGSSGDVQLLTDLAIGATIGDEFGHDALQATAAAIASSVVDARAVKESAAEARIAATPVSESPPLHPLWWWMLGCNRTRGVEWEATDGGAEPRLMCSAARRRWRALCVGRLRR